MKQTDKERTRTAEFALATGMMLGFLTAPDILAYLADSGITEGQVENIKEDLMKIARAFYKDR